MADSRPLSEVVSKSHDIHHSLRSWLGNGGQVLTDRDRAATTRSEWRDLFTDSHVRGSVASGTSAVLIMMAAFAIADAAVILDRIAVIAGNSVIKDSDIDRDIRVTDFLNRDPLEFSEASRKRSADRLIDQALIRREIEVAQYPFATDQDVNGFLDQIRKQRFKNDANYKRALQDYGLADTQLRRALKWQLTVLRFIDMRFRPGVLVTDQDVTRYYNAHLAELTRENGGKQPTLDEAREKIENQLTGERVNQQFEAWLAETRKNANVQYREASLK